MHDIWSLVKLPLVILAGNQSNHTLFEINTVFLGQCRPNDGKQRSPQLLRYSGIGVLDLTKRLDQVTNLDIPDFRHKSLAISYERLQLTINHNIGFS